MGAYIIVKGFRRIGFQAPKIAYSNGTNNNQYNRLGNQVLSAKAGFEK